MNISAALLYGPRLSPLGSDAELVEQAAQQRRLDQDAGQAERADRLQVDLLEGGGEIVAARAGAELAEAVGIGVGELALRAEARDRGAQLLALCQARALRR